jgi:hypothetical protein
VLVPRARSSNLPCQKLVDIVAHLQYIYSSIFDFLKKRGWKLTRRLNSDVH